MYGICLWADLWAPRYTDRKCCDHGQRFLVKLQSISWTFLWTHLSNPSLARPLLSLFNQNLYQDHGIQSHHSWQIETEKVEAVTDFIFLGSKITADGDYGSEIKRHLLLEQQLLYIWSGASSPGWRLITWSASSKNPCQGSPWWFSGQDTLLPMQEIWVWSLVRELDTICAATKTNKEINI